MNKTSFKDKLVIVLAYMNRYVFPFSIIFFSTVFGEEYKSHINWLDIYAAGNIFIAHTRMPVTRR